MAEPTIPAAELEQLRAENRQLRAWNAYLQDSVDKMVDGLAGALNAHRSALKAMSPLNGGDGETLPVPD